MAKLHELLAVSTNMDGQVNKVTTDLSDTFAKKRHLFESKISTFFPSAEGSTPATETASDIQTSIAKEIEWAFGTIAKGIDVGYQIDVANTQAKADIVTEDGETVLKDVPATFLLQLEKRLTAVHGLIGMIPTFDPAKGFAEDASRGVGIFKAREVNKNRTAKIEDYQVVYPATTEHPAQIVKVTKDVVTGRLQEQEWSSLITPALKSDLIGRCDVLLRAVKKARARANDTAIDAASNKVGKVLLNWLSQPLSK